MPRYVGVDLGSRRIGIAVSDPHGVLATPYGVLDRTSDEPDASAIVEIMRGEDAREIVLGLPLSLDGTKGHAAMVVEAFAQRLKAAGGRVRLWDERFSTVEAEKSLKSQGMKGKQRRQNIDKTAATVMLQGFLDKRAQEQVAKAAERQAAKAAAPTKKPAAKRGVKKPAVAAPKKPAKSLAKRIAKSLKGAAKGKAKPKTAGASPKTARGKASAASKRASRKTARPSSTKAAAKKKAAPKKSPRRRGTRA